MTTQAAEVVVPCPALVPELDFFTKQLGFRVEVIFPADSPKVAVVAGYGVRLRLDATVSGPAPRLRLLTAGPTPGDGRVSPAGTVVEFALADPPLTLPPEQQTYVVTRRGNDAEWGVGRAGMRYRDLVPDRQGGRFIASHIAIPDGGPVPDYVHFHKIRFQLIFCRRGWVRVAYEDQGDPIVMHAGDCVLQAPEIRHRVLEASPGMEVVEIGCPAEHETRVDHDLVLPTGRVRPDRDFGGQRFVFHVAAGATWVPWLAGFEARDSGIGAATDGLAGVRVVRPSGGPGQAHRFDSEFCFGFVLDGGFTLVVEAEQPERLGPDDAFVIPGGRWWRWAEPDPSFQMLVVTLPADPAHESRAN